MPAAQILIAPGAKPHCGIITLLESIFLMNSVVSTSSVRSKYPMFISAATVPIFLLMANGPADITAFIPFRNCLTWSMSLASKPSVISPCLIS